MRRTPLNTRPLGPWLGFAEGWAGMTRLTNLPDRTCGSNKASSATSSPTGYLTVNMVKGFTPSSIRNNS